MERKTMWVKEWFVDKAQRETEKAVYVNLSTGDTLGSIAGWKTWIPKSVIMEV